MTKNEEMCLSKYLKSGMTGLIVGDAVGMPVQFEGRSERVADPVTDMRGYGCFDMPRGAWTDDSSLALATLYSIRTQGKVDIDDIARQFALWLVDGLFTPLGFAYDIGNGCRNAIEKYLRTGDAENCGGNKESDNGNGSLMRILPACIYLYSEARAGRMEMTEAVKLVEAASAVTHAHVRSKIACGIYFFIVSEVMEHPALSLYDVIGRGLQDAREYYRKDISRLTELARYGRLFELDKFRELPESDIRSSGYVVDSLEAAIWSLVNTDNYKDCILKAVNLGSDTDTIAAIAGGIAGLHYGYEGIPADWSEGIMRREWIEEMCDMTMPLPTADERIMTDCHSHYIPEINIAF